MDSVRTFVDQAQGFIDRHPGLNEAQQSFGGTAWGMLRALAECPDCPGVYRRPLDPEWRTLLCPGCRGVWAMRDGG